MLGSIQAVYLQFVTTGGYCAPQEYNTSPEISNTVVIPLTPGVFIRTGNMFGMDIAPNSLIFQELGLDPSWNCSGDGEGEPFYNIPVLALTATSTVTQGDTPVPPTTVTKASPAPTKTPELPISTLTPDKSIQQTVSGSVGDGQPSVEPVSGEGGLRSSAPPADPSPDLAVPAPSPPAVSTIPLVKTTLSPDHSEIVTLAGRPVTVDFQGNYHIDGQTLRPGGPSIDVSGTVYPLFPSATALAVGTTTIPLVAGLATSPDGHVITIDGRPITANS